MGGSGQAREVGLVWRERDQLEQRVLALLREGGHVTRKSSLRVEARAGRDAWRRVRRKEAAKKAIRGL